MQGQVGDLSYRIQFASLSGRPHMKTILTMVLALGIAAVARAEEKKVDKQRVFEMRTYYANPGKLQALHARFRDHTNGLFKKHGMDIIGYWVPNKQKEGEEKLIYILAYPSKEAADKSWKAFREDPEWKK